MRPARCGLVPLVGAAALAFALVTPAAAGEDEVLAAGRALFVEDSEPQCGICHTLAEAETEGEVGPNLDELMPSEDQVKKAVTEGIEAMPAYSDTLGEDEIAALALYVSTVAGRR